MGNKADAHWEFTRSAAWDKNARHFADIFCLNSHFRFLFNVKHAKKKKKRHTVIFLEWNLKEFQFNWNLNLKKLKAVQTCYLL